jgi:hypothetical protein
MGRRASRMRAQHVEARALGQCNRPGGELQAGRQPEGDYALRARLPFGSARP